MTFATNKRALCRWSTWWYQLAVRKSVYSPPSLMWWGSSSVALIRTELDDSQQCWTRRGDAVLTAPTVSTCSPGFFHLLPFWVEMMKCDQLSRVSEPEIYKVLKSGTKAPATQPSWTLNKQPLTVLKTRQNNFNIQVTPWKVNQCLP